MMDGMLGYLDLLNYRNWVASPFSWLAFAFTLWMLVDAIRREEWVWVVFIILFPLINAALYFFLVYRGAPALSGGRFEFPGAADRRRIRELEGQIHHLDKAHHHAQLGDIYLRQGKLAKAEVCYRHALEREPQDLDTQTHLGRALLGLGRAAEALPLLECVCQAQPKHDYGYSLMGLAEAYSKLGNKDKALETWRRVVENYSYARARVELAELYLAAGQRDLARTQLMEALADDAHAPEFERRQERVWIKKAKRLLGTIQG